MGTKTGTSKKCERKFVSKEILSHIMLFLLFFFLLSSFNDRNLFFDKFFCSYSLVLLLKVSSLRTLLFPSHWMGRKNYLVALFFGIKYVSIITILNLKTYNKLFAENCKKKILTNPPELQACSPKCVFVKKKAKLIQ